MTRTTTIQMLDRVDQLRDDLLPPLRAELEAIEDEAAEYDDLWDIPDDLERRYEQAQQEVKALEGEADTLEHYAEEWGDDEFVIREFSVGGVGRVQDDVAEASNVDMRGDGTPKAGYARQRAIAIALKDKPTSAPDVEELPDAIGDWLYDCIDEFNTTGEVSLGNSSLRAAMLNSEN